MPGRGLTARQRGNLRSLSPVYLYGPPGSRCIFQTLYALRVILLPPRRDRDGADA